MYRLFMPNATEAEIAAAEAAVLASVQPDIDEIHARLAAGEAFADLIPDYTIDPGMMDAASIAAGYQVHAQSTGFVIPFRDAAFTVDNVGDVTAPVVTDYGVHILCYAGDVPSGPVPYTSDVEAILRESLLVPRQATVYQQTIDAWMNEAEIVYSEEAQTILSSY